MPALRTLLALSCPALFLFAAACHDGGSGPPSATIDGAGGTFEVTSGPLRGTILSVPPGAMTGVTTIAFTEIAPPEVDGFVAVGNATELSPRDLEFAQPAVAQFLFRPADLQIVSAHGADDVLVLHADSSGAITALVPDNVDTDTGRAVVPIEHLGTFWVAVRPDGATIAIDDYLPRTGDWFLFDDGRQLFDLPQPNEINVARAGLEMLDVTASVPGLGPAIRLEHSGFYLQRNDGGSMSILGSYRRDSISIASSYQSLAATPLVIPSFVLENARFDVLGNFGVYAPYGTDFAIPATGSLRVEVGERHAVTTPAGTFGDCLPVRIEYSQTIGLFYVVELELARGIGPVQYTDPIGLGSLRQAVSRGLLIR